MGVQVYLSTGADELARLRASRSLWERRLRWSRWLAQVPFLRRWAFPRWQQAWREIWHRNHVEEVVAEEGAENLSGMDYTILELGVPNAPKELL